MEGLSSEERRILDGLLSADPGAADALAALEGDVTAITEIPPTHQTRPLPWDPPEGGRAPLCFIFYAADDAIPITCVDQ